MAMWAPTKARLALSAACMLLVVPLAALTPAVVFGKRYPIVLGHQQRPYFLQAITLCVKNANLVRMRALCALPALSAALISMTVHLLAVIPTTSSRKPKLNALGCPKCSFCV